MTWPPNRVMVGTDFSDAANAALEIALDIARRSGADVDVVHALHDPNRMVTGYEIVDALLTYAENPDKLREAALTRLEADVKRLAPPMPELHLVQGDAAAEIVALRELLEADLVVLGAQGLRGVRRFLLGSVADRVLRHPGCPLLLVNRRPPAGEFKKILVALELPDRVTPWLEAGLSLAHDLRGELVVAHVLPARGYLSDRRHVELHPESAAERMEKLVAGLDATIPVQSVVRQGDPSQMISEIAQELDIDLAVLGAERHADGWPGHVADHVVRAGLPATLVIWPEPVLAG